MRRFYIEKRTDKDQVVFIEGSDANHITNVLRHKIGDKIALFDGAGFTYSCVITGQKKNSVEIRVDEKIKSLKDPDTEIIIAQSFLKDKKMDVLVRQLTELGMTKWIPFFSKRSIPNPDKKRLKKRDERWKKITFEAVKQCERGLIPEIHEVISFDELMEYSDQCDLKIIFWESEKFTFESFISTTKKDYKKIMIILGPEGGFSEEEVEKAKKNGFVSVSLGPRILRTETASLAACTLIQYFFGDIANKST